MNVSQIENKLILLVFDIDKETFIYNLLESYYLPKASISRLQKGNLNLSKVPGEVSWKKKLFFKEEFNKDLHLTISALKTEIKHNQRFIIVTDYETLLAVDTVTQDQLDIPINELPKYYDFFLPWAGMEKATHAAENPADVKAAEKMAKLFDEIKKDNPDTSAEFSHNLNIFFSRLLFCYFAEDTNIFEDNQFSHAIESHTRGDGSDLDEYLNRLFWILNTPKDNRGDIPNFLNAFPYVNGGLFKEGIPCPKFTSKSRQLLIDSGDSNDWSAINPDIFGSMFQAVISPEHRGGLGAHYTSVPNIMKVIEPLFLNELKDEFENANGNEKKLRELLHRISKIKLFDPACGSGNFLIIAYKELRRLEMQILKELGGLAFSGIHLNNFYGIELDDFAHEIAKLSLWLAEHQMNVEFFNEFGRTNPTLPLQEAGQIVCGNACRLDWEEVCPKNDGSEIYILGNPPYVGSTQQNKEQKKDMDLAFVGIPNYKNLDYISIWFLKAGEFISNAYQSKYSFVSTNSITQGEQVALLWEHIYRYSLEIYFAYQSFKWTNNAKKVAGVSVVIIGITHKKKSKKILYQNNLVNYVDNINPYLKATSNLIVHKRNTSISNLPQMISGNKPVDGGFLLLDEKEKNDFLQHDERSVKYIKKFIGAQELINGTTRYCLWIKDHDLREALSIKDISNRISETSKFRLESKDLGAQKLASKSHQFRDFFQSNDSTILVPQTTSENRKYIPVGYLSSDFIISNGGRAIFDAEPWIFSLLNSKIHNNWVQTVAGRLETRIQYSNTLCYNTFPFPTISNQRKEELTQCTFRILEEREKHPEKTLAHLYDPDKMPEGLKEAHRLNDEAVERCYRSTPFNSDEERLEYLFKLYEKMIQEEKEKGTLFEAEKKTRKKK
jgi:type I restriction-modification system DNA methylase subunit